MRGKFVISLDFEKYWGMRDHKTIESYEENLKLVDDICFRTLHLFKKFEIHATWAAVGFLIFKDKEELLQYIPAELPKYKNTVLNPYSYINDFKLDPQFHFAKSVIKEIVETSNQELATHTFSHYYCSELGNNKAAFDEDLKTAVSVFKSKLNVDVKSIILPRNQVNKQYLQIIKKNSIRVYRGNEKNWIFNLKMPNLMTRMFRLIDSYVNITGSNTYKLDKCKEEYLYNIPSSRFLRPVSAKNSMLKKLRLNRIKSQMTYAAKHNEIFHLWWHPHNFGNDIEANMIFLDAILEHYSFLNKTYHMESVNMKEALLKI